MGSELGISEDSDPEMRLDAAAIFYASFAGVWTLCIIAGAAFLVKNRHNSVVRIRGIALSLCAVAFLHCYWVSVQLGYMFGPVMPGDAEYWIMGLWLPLGIALFQASNSRFLHIARAQRRYVDHFEKDLGQSSSQKKNLMTRFRRMDHTKRAFILVGGGMVFQVCLIYY